MLTYLNNTQSDGRPGRVPNQNYARELMELHTLGVDGGYTQQDVVEVARCFTGWRTFCNTGDSARRHVLLRPQPARQQQQDRARRADCGWRRVQRRTERSEHPHQPSEHARFVSTKLLRWLLNYDPSPALVADIAGEFTRTGGNIKALVRRILHYDNVLWSPPLFKRPFHYIVSALRVMNANITSLSTIRQTYLAGTGHTPYAWGPPDGYPQEFEYRGGLPLPRWNFAFQLANNSISGATVDLTALLAGATSRGPDCRPHRHADLRG